MKYAMIMCLALCVGCAPMAAVLKAGHLVPLQIQGDTPVVSMQVGLDAEAVPHFDWNFNASEGLLALKGLTSIVTEKLGLDWLSGVVANWIHSDTPATPPAPTPSGSQ